MTRRYYVNNAPTQTLASSITNASTTCTVAGSFSGWPTQFPFYATLDYGELSEEIVLVTNIVGTTATITRAQDGSAAVSHAAGATFDFSVVAKDYDEANSHVNSNTGVHGISGHVVGDTDSQTLSNKTLSSPALTGTMTGAGALNIGGGVTSGGAAAFAGASTAASYTANGDGKVAGVVVPKSYTNEAAATTAGANVAGAEVWLTAPTTGPVGLYVWSSTAAAWLPVHTPQTVGFLGENTNVASVTLSTTTAFAGSATVTFTLAVQTRVKITTVARYRLGSTTGGRLQLLPVYNTGSSAVIGSAVFNGGQIHIANYSATTGVGGASSGTAVGTVLLPAGTYTAYASVTRATGGSASDLADAFYTLVEAVGNV